MWKALLKRWWYLLILAFIAFRIHQFSAREEWVNLTFFSCLPLGMGMNFIVIVLNRGMPAAVELEEIAEEKRDQYHPIDESTRLSWLGDWITVGDSLYSPGDVVLIVGMIGQVASLFSV